MSYFSLSNRTSNVTIANPCLEIISPATVRPKIMQISIVMAAATASVFGLGRPQAVGITPTSPVVLGPWDPADPTTTFCSTALAWATPPTIPLAFFERVSLAAAVGAGIIWTFPDGLVIPASSSMIIWNISATGVSDITVVVKI